MHGETAVGPAPKGPVRWSEACTPEIARLRGLIRLKFSEIYPCGFPFSAAAAQSALGHVSRAVRGKKKRAQVSKKSQRAVGLVKFPAFQLTLQAWPQQAIFKTIGMSSFLGGGLTSP